jgi:hypothetical protein
MLPQYTAALRQFLNQLDPPWSKPQRGNFLDLGAAFLKRRSLPIRRLARGTTGPTPAVRAVDRRFRRFLGSDRLDRDGTLRAYLALLLPRFGAVPCISVALDWTYVKNHAILWAQIPYRGRSFPLLVAIHPTTKVDPESEFQTQAEMELLRTLENCWPKWAPPPLLLADRGFAKGELIDWLVARKWLFLIRIGRQALCRTAAGERLPETRIVAPGEQRRFPNIRYHAQFQLALHLVVSGAWDQHGKPSEWRLLTNLPAAELRHVPKWYGDRMSPEETHRDCKRGHFVSGFALSHLERMRADRLERYLFLLGLIYCFLILVAETDRETRQWFALRH